MSRVKNRSTFRVLSLLLVVALVSTVMLSGTFAKYTSEYSGEDTALVAKWAFTIVDGEDNDFETQLDLFTHEYNKNINQKDGTDYIIAPGVGGKFTLDITNESDVAAAITFDVKEVTGSADVPMQFKIGEAFGGTGTATVYDNVDDLSTALSGQNIVLQDSSATTGQNYATTVYWQWPFEVGSGDTLKTNDAADTLLGKTSVTDDRTEYTLEVTVTASQVLPDIE